MTLPNLGIKKIGEGQFRGFITYNEASIVLDAVVQHGVVGYRTTASPPGSPAEGSVYIVGAATPTGLWAAADQYDVAIFYDGVWSFLTPRPGWTFWVIPESRFRVYNGSNWNRYIVPTT